MRRSICIVVLRENLVKNSSFYPRGFIPLPHIKHLLWRRYERNTGAQTHNVTIIVAIHEKRSDSQ